MVARGFLRYPALISQLTQNNKQYVYSTIEIIKYLLEQMKADYVEESFIQVSEEQQTPLNSNFLMPYTFQSVKFIITTILKSQKGRPIDLDRKTLTSMIQGVCNTKTIEDFTQQVNELCENTTKQ